MKWEKKDKVKEESKVKKEAMSKEIKATTFSSEAKAED